MTRNLEKESFYKEFLFDKYIIVSLLFFKDRTEITKWEPQIIGGGEIERSELSGRRGKTKLFKKMKIKYQSIKSTILEN